MWWVWPYLDGCGVDDPLSVLEGECNGVLRHDGLAGRSVSRDQDTLLVLHTEQRLTLERVQDERVLLVHDTAIDRVIVDESPGNY